MSSYKKIKNDIVVDGLFALLVAANLIIGFLLVVHIPYSYPFGGPDELMHLSMAEYIAKHLSWPNWDSKEVVRNAYGVSYSAGGSIVYWLHGLTYKIFGHHRIGAFMLLMLYLVLSVFFYRKNKLSGFLLLAALFPQTLFIFSYVNSDSGTIISALLMGMGVALFLVGNRSIKNMLLFFLFAGFAVTARQHLWAIAFVTFIWALMYNRKVLLGYNKKAWLYAFLIGLLPASWWFITSYFANDGDLLGVFTNAKSIAKFSQGDLPSLSREWHDISTIDFFSETFKSLYANWGWLAFGLDVYAYVCVGILVFVIMAISARYIDKKIFIFLIVLVLINLGFMLVYSTFYDYQAQGRYLFPSLYIIIGILATIFTIQKVDSKPLLIMLILLSTLNTACSTKLLMTSYMDMFIEKPVRWHPKTIEFDNNAVHHIDQVDMIGGKVLVRGWIYDGKNGKVFDDVYLVFKQNGKYYKAALDQEKRPDVARVFNNPKLVPSGFSAKMIDVGSLEKGAYHILIGVSKDNKIGLVDPKIPFKL